MCICHLDVHMFEKKIIIPTMIDFKMEDSSVSEINSCNRQLYLYLTSFQEWSFVFLVDNLNNTHRKLLLF